MIDDQRKKVVEEALSWVKTPFCHRGRVKGAGVDCAMFLAEVYERAGVLPHIDPPFYPPDWHMHRNDELLLEIVEQFCIPVESPKPGDIALYKFGRCIAHGVIVTEWPMVVHALVGVGVLPANADLEIEGKRLHGFYSPQGGTKP